MRNIDYRIVHTGTAVQPESHILIFVNGEEWSHRFKDVKDLENFVGQLLDLIPRVERDVKGKP